MGSHRSASGPYPVKRTRYWTCRRRPSISSTSYSRSGSGSSVGGRVRRRRRACGFAGERGEQAGEQVGKRAGEQVGKRAGEQVGDRAGERGGERLLLLLPSSSAKILEEEVVGLLFGETLTRGPHGRLVEPADGLADRLAGGLAGGLASGQELFHTGHVQ